MSCRDDGRPRAAPALAAGAVAAAVLAAKRDRTARVIIRGHALMQNLRRGHDELGVDARSHRRVASAFTELARAV